MVCRVPVRALSILSALVVLLLPFSVEAITISISEAVNETDPITFEYDPTLSDCSGGFPCVFQEIHLSPEDAITLLVFDPATFTSNLSANALLLEPLAEDPSGRGISDIITLSIINAGAFDLVGIRMRSDADPSTFGQIPEGFPDALRLVEDGTLQDVTAFFFSGPLSAPVAIGEFLPGDLFIRARSDVEGVPEPNSLVLFALGLGGLAASRFARLWSRRSSVSKSLSRRS